MAKDDWAIVVGIQLYPALTNLDGPVNDATEIHKWLIGNDGGQVPAEQVALITSPPPPYNPPLPPAQTAEPRHATVQEAFDHLLYVAEENAAAGNGKRVGRRLYIYMSGHGCAPRDQKAAALLAANATRTIVGYHILGRLYADWFLQSNYFEEVVLWMDCCRENYPQAPPNIPPYISTTGPNALDKSKLFYGFATKWSRLARERPMDDGHVHGVFTFALLSGLKGAAADPTSGQITAATLGDYLYTNIKSFLRPEDLEDNVDQDPEIDYDKNPANSFVIATVPVPRYRININLPNTTAGKKIEIFTDKFAFVSSATAQPPLWQLDLPRGTYMVQVLANGLQHVFDVTGIGDVHVNV